MISRVFSKGIVECGEMQLIFVQVLSGEIDHFFFMNPFFHNLSLRFRNYQNNPRNKGFRVQSPISQVEQAPKWLNWFNQQHQNSECRIIFNTIYQCPGPKSKQITKAGNGCMFGHKLTLNGSKLPRIWTFDHTFSQSSCYKTLINSIHFVSQSIYSGKEPADSFGVVQKLQTMKFHSAQDLSQFIIDAYNGKKCKDMIAFCEQKFNMNQLKLDLYGPNLILRHWECHQEINCCTAENNWNGINRYLFF